MSHAVPPVQRQQQPARGFTLLEVLVAMAVLAIGLTVITASSTASAIHARRVYRSTVAALLMRGTVLDIEEKYRKDGFPTNDVTGKDCDLPKAYARQFKCSYDLIGLNLDDAAISDMTTQANEMLTKAQETLAQTGALDKLSAGNAGSAADAARKALDGGSAAKGAQDTQLDLSSIAKGGDLMGLLGTLLMSGQQGLFLLDLCDINIGMLQMSMGLMVSELLPRILKRASDRTRKLVLHLSWKDAEGEQADLQIESFLTAVSAEEAAQIQQMKNMDNVQNALNPTGALPGVPGMPGASPGMGVPGMGVPGLGAPRPGGGR